MRLNKIPNRVYQLVNKDTATTLDGYYTTRQEARIARRENSQRRGDILILDLVIATTNLRFVR